MQARTAILQIGADLKAVAPELQVQILVILCVLSNSPVGYYQPGLTCPTIAPSTLNHHLEYVDASDEAKSNLRTTQLMILHDLHQILMRQDKNLDHHLV